MLVKKDHIVQITVAVIGALAAILAAIISPLISDYLENNKKYATVSERYQGSVSQDMVNKKQDPGGSSTSSKSGMVDRKKSVLQQYPETELFTKDDSIELPLKHDKKTRTTKKKKPSEVATVFNDNFVMLCGYQKIRAKVIQLKDGTSAIRLTSRMQNIPTGSFRGYENTLPIGEVVELWKDCFVEFNYEIVSGITRLEVIHYGR